MKSNSNLENIRNKETTAPTLYSPKNVTQSDHKEPESDDLHLQGAGSSMQCRKEGAGGGRGAFAHVCITCASDGQALSLRESLNKFHCA